MKFYIVQELNQYSIYKVSDHLMTDFENEKNGRIVVESKTISEALKKFETVDKILGLEFKSELLNYKMRQSERLDDLEIKRKNKMKLG
jgi:hypothetical protein